MVRLPAQDNEVCSPNRHLGTERKVINLLGEQLLGNTQWQAAGKPVKMA